MISILVPVKDAERFLRSTLLSVRAQTWSDWEAVIVIDSKSRDSSADIAREMAAVDPRFRLYTGSRNGVSNVRNFALDQARGEYIAFLDSDDLWLPNKLEIQLAAMKMANSALSCTSFRRISLDGTRVGRKISPPAQISYRRLLQQNCMLMSSVMVRREAIGLKRFRDMGCEDFAFWLDLLRDGENGLGLNQDLVRYRIVPNSRGSSKWRSFTESWAVLRAQTSVSLPMQAANLALLGARGAMKYARF